MHVSSLYTIFWIWLR